MAPVNITPLIVTNDRDGPQGQRRRVVSSGLVIILADCQVMNPERWERIRQLQEAARTRRPEERRSFLDSACGGDEILRREVETLLANDTGGATQTLVGVGAQLGPYKLEVRLG